MADDGPFFHSGPGRSKSCFCRVHKKYEEVLVPALKKAVAPEDERVVRVSEMPDWAQLAFDGYQCSSKHNLFTISPLVLVCIRLLLPLPADTWNTQCLERARKRG